MKTRLVIGLSVLSSLCLFGFAVRHASSWDVLPPIKNSERLHKDYILLSEQFPLPPLKTNQMLFKALNNTNMQESFRRHFRQAHAREIPRESWPNSIKELNPFRVTRDEYAVCIWLLDRDHMNHKTHGPTRNWVAKGYYVHTNASESPPRSATHGFALYYLYETKYEGIDEFNLPAIVL